MVVAEGDVDRKGGGCSGARYVDVDAVGGSLVAVLEVVGSCKLIVVIEVDGCWGGG